MIRSIKPETFFRLLAVNAGLTDLRIVKEVYYALVKTMSRELKNNQVVRLPDWGEFRLKICKARKHRDVNDRSLVYILPPRPVVKFSPDLKVKKYFYEFGKEGGTLNS